MKAVFIYVVLFQVVSIVARDVAPQPAGSIALFGLISLQMAVATVLLWRRWRLVSIAAFFATAAIWAGAFAISAAAGVQPPMLFAIAPIVLTLLVMTLFIPLEYVVYPARWERFDKAPSTAASVWDIVLLRHMRAPRD